ncbi:MAG TPA: hypothetical protein VFT47_10075 [Vicinamibacterales bacterium]|nr:hypothetical protein [Vicinamibacterales bacterium]
MRLIAVVVAAAALASTPAHAAASICLVPSAEGCGPARNPYARLFAPAATPERTTSPAPQSPAPAVPIEYSDAYRTRLKIHKIASFATLPLFATELILGQSLYDDGGEGGKKDAHVVVGASIGVLFGINTVTGVWNLWESRKDPNARTRRIVHSVLMLAADAGFVATAALAPESEHGSVSDDRGAHRAVAITSIGLATTSYLIMLFTR